MYESFYNLRERPFSLSPDPEYLYLGRVHREALDSLRYGIESRAGFMVVTGDIGAGKTTLLQSLLHRLDERTITARLVNTTMEPREVLEAIALDFGLETTGKSKPVLLRDLGQFLCEQRAQGRRPLLVIDEAQNLSAAALEEVRLLSNLETEKSKLLQILFVGQPNLRETIDSPELEQFRQRVAVSYHLTSLDGSQTAEYIDFRLRLAAKGEPLRFPGDAAALVYRHSGGVPRLINVICDSALLYGYAEDKREIDRALIEATVVELQTSGVLRTADRRAAVTPPSPTVATPAASPEKEAAVPVITRQPERSIIATTEAAAQAAHLAERESRLAERERELEEQRIVLADQFKALRSMYSEGAPVNTPAPSAAVKQTGAGVYASSIRPKLADVWRRFMPRTATND
jgi:putative secretion ATPase (PEP-CTERM system associated)